MYTLAQRQIALSGQHREVGLRLKQVPHTDVLKYLGVEKRDHHQKGENIYLQQYKELEGKC